MYIIRFFAVEPYFLLAAAYEVEMSFFKPRRSKFSAKKRVNLLHSGSSHGKRTVFPPERVGIVVQIGVHLLWDVVVP